MEVSLQTNFWNIHRFAGFLCAGVQVKDKARPNPRLNWSQATCNKWPSRQPNRLVPSKKKEKIRLALSPQKERKKNQTCSVPSEKSQTCSCSVLRSSEVSRFLNGNNIFLKWKYSVFLGVGGRNDFFISVGTHQSRWYCSMIASD